MVMINEEGVRAGTSNGGRGDDQDQQHDAYDKDFPPGYRFQPTDQELIKDYLFRKVNSFRLPPNRFADINFYSCNPWELAAAYQSYGENIHYFFTPREKKYPNGHRPNRAAGVGFWKACGADKPIHDEGKKIGSKRSLVFYVGKPSIKDEAEKTNWIMHEYTLKKSDEEEENVEKKKGTTSRRGSYTTASNRENRRIKKLCPYLENPKNMQLDGFVLCKLYLKLDKSTKEYPDDDPCDEDITREENNINVAAAPPSMATASAVDPVNYHPMHQYPSTSMVVGTEAAMEKMELVDGHYPSMHQTIVDAPGYHQSSLSLVIAPTTQADVPGYHQSSLTSLVIAPTTQAETMPFCNGEYSGNINPSSAVDLPFCNVDLPFCNGEYSGNINPSSVDHHYHYHDEDVWEILREWNEIDQSQSNFLGSAGFFVPDIKADIDPK